MFFWSHETEVLGVALMFGLGCLQIHVIPLLFLLLITKALR